MILSFFLALQVPARCLSSDITKSEENEVYASLSLRTPTIKLLYLTPEKVRFICPSDDLS